jgi:hypothetical protein
MFPACSLFAEVSVNSSLLAKKSEGQVAPVSPGSGIKSQLQDCSKVLDARLQLNEGHTKGNSGCGHSESLLQPPGAAVETLLFSENTVHYDTVENAWTAGCSKRIKFSDSSIEFQVLVRSDNIIFIVSVCILDIRGR